MAAESFELMADGASDLLVTGQITFANAGRALAALPEPRVPLAIDLAGLADADGAALAVLVAWAAHAQRHNNRIRYLNAPRSLRNLAHLSGLDGLFGETSAGA